jgi:hypothetical protein
MRINTAAKGPNPVQRRSHSGRALLLKGLKAFAVFALVAGTAAAAPPRVDEKELLAAGFKVLVATTPVQENWVKGLPPGQIRPMQRNGRKFFIYPDAPGNRIYVGGPAENDAYLALHPGGEYNATEAALKASAYRGKEDVEMRKDSARDLSDPFLGVGWGDVVWGDLGW